MGVERIFVSFPFGRSRERSLSRRPDAILAPWSIGTSSVGELAPRFALQTGASLRSPIPIPRSSPMSAVLALKRNQSTVRYCFEADAEPGVLPRALELLAKRGLVPARVFAHAADDLLSVEIEVEGLAPATAHHVAPRLAPPAALRHLL